MKTLILISTLFLASCSNGKYIGPRVDLSAGFMGASVGVTLYGESVVKPTPPPTTPPVTTVREVTGK